MGARESAPWDLGWTHQGGVHRGLEVDLPVGSAPED